MAAAIWQQNGGAEWRRGPRSRRARAIDATLARGVGVPRLLRHRLRASASQRHQASLCIMIRAAASRRRVRLLLHLPLRREQDEHPKGQDGRGHRGAGRVWGVRGRERGGGGGAHARRIGHRRGGTAAGCAPGWRAAA
jgi:hypothetical protein